MGFVFTKYKRGFVSGCYWVMLCGVIGLLAVCTSAKAQADTEKDNTLVEVLRQAYHQNPTLRAARLQLKSSHENLSQAAAGWRPTVTATGEVLANTTVGSNFGNADGSTSKEVGIGFNQPIYQGGQVYAEYEATNKRILAQSAVLNSTVQQILLEAVAAYMDVLRDEALLDLSRQNENVIARQLEAANDRFTVGELTKTDVAQSEARHARALSDTIAAKADLETSRARFEQIVGTFPHTLVYSDVSLPLPETVQDAVELAQVQNPDILSAEMLHEASEHDIRDIFGELLPSLSLFGNWARTYDPQPGTIDNTTSKSVGATLTIPLYQAGSVRSRVRQAKYDSNRLFIEIMEVKRQIRQNVIANWEAWKAAKAEIDSRKRQVEASMVAREGVYYENVLGARTVLDTLDADQELLDARVSLVTAKRNEIVTRFSLAASLGLLTPVNIGFGDEKYDFEEHLNTVSSNILGTNVDIDKESYD